MKSLPPGAAEPQPYEDVLFDREQLNLDARIRARYDEDIVLILQRISKYLFDIGLPLSEACELSGMPSSDFNRLMENDSDIQRLVYLKELAFKRDMLSILAKKARAGDTDIAEKLLEQRYPNEYGKKRNTNPQGENTLGAAIEWVRQNGDSSPLVSPTSGRAVILTRGQFASKAAIKSIEEFLK